jgi:preprotein translocase subunit SecE
MASLGQYFQETRGELRKVVWPTRQEATNLTIIVIVVTIAMTIILSSVDYVFSEILRIIVENFGVA